MAKISPLLGIGVACGIVFLLYLAKGAAGSQCRVLSNPMEYYYLKYTGPDQTWQAALGECYSAIYTLEVFDSWYGDYLTPQELGIEILLKESECRVMVIEPCELCGFSKSSPVI